MLWCHPFVPVVWNCTCDSPILLSFLISDRYTSGYSTDVLQNQTVLGKSTMKFNGCSSVLSMIICLKKFCIKKYQTGIFVCLFSILKGLETLLFFSFIFFHKQCIYISAYIHYFTISETTHLYWPCWILRAVTFWPSINTL